VLVRELVQNARDAGASQVVFETSEADGRERLVCRDDGRGMTFEHAERYLFTLYASDKTGRKGSAGRFGIGFWSVLRFEPDVVIVRSRADGAEGWQVQFDGRLSEPTRGASEITRGTEIVLERPTRNRRLADALTRAILRDAPFVRRLGVPATPLELVVDGRLVRSELSLPPPSLGFARRGLTGAVGLGVSPSVSVFSHGLKVRDGVSLDDLTLTSRRRRAVVGPAAEGLAPRVVMDSSELQVLMARGDAREDRALRRLVTVGHRELRRLVRLELDRLAAGGPLSRAREMLAELRTHRTLRWGVAAAAAVATLAAGYWAASMVVDPRPQLTVSSQAASAGPPSPARPVPYRDVSRRYRGPAADGVGGHRAAVDLRYRPAFEQPYFAAIRLTGLQYEGRPDGGPPGPVAQYLGPPCSNECLEVDVSVVAEGEYLRVPVATGHLLDPQSLKIDGRQVEVFADSSGQPVVRTDGVSAGRLTYRSRRHPDRSAPPPAKWPELPPQGEFIAAEIDGVEPSTAAPAVAAAIATLVRYDTSEAVAERHRQLASRGLGLFERTLSIGRGDCDLQNVLAAAILDRAGVPARLAVGWVGSEGMAAAGLHAWVEYRGRDRIWRVADASASTPLASGGRGARDVGASPPETRGQRPELVLGLVLAGLALVAGGLLLARPSWDRRFEPGDSSDLVGLLRGAAVRPEAYARVRALFSRPVVPLLGGRLLSLGAAQSKARAGRLASGRSSSAIAAEVAAAGGSVLDVQQPVGEAVAAALAALDLDRWQQHLDRAVEPAVARRVEKMLAGAGERCRVMVAENLGEPLSVLDLSVMGRSRVQRWVLVDAEGEIWKRVADLDERRPGAAEFALADAVLEGIGARDATVRRVLREPAARAIMEAAAGARS
jgi:transglutaminase-like putative cysteine protease